MWIWMHNRSYHYECHIWQNSHKFAIGDKGLLSVSQGIEASTEAEGVYHTVNPVANDMIPVYRENHREYTMIRSRNFGDVIQMEVGALMVGRITNHHGAAKVTRGQEKGYFEFGGSTIVLLFEKDRVVIDDDIIKNTKNGFETRVLMGDKIGVRKAYGES